MTPMIRGAEGTETESAVSALTMSFVADPLFRWMWPGGESYLRNFPRLVRAFGGRAFDHGAAHVDDDFGGTALWLPPGAEPDGEAVLALFEETLKGARRTEAVAVLEQMEQHHTKERHWYLAFIGVDTARQGEGLGSLLIRRGLEACDAGGFHAYLESSNPANIPFYRRHGFEVVAEVQVGSAPVVTPMIRPPA